MPVAPVISPADHFSDRFVAPANSGEIAVRYSGNQGIPVPLAVDSGSREGVSEKVRGRPPSPSNICVQPPKTLPGRRRRQVDLGEGLLIPVVLQDVFNLFLVLPSPWGSRGNVRIAAFLQKLRFWTGSEEEVVLCLFHCDLKHSLVIFPGPGN